MEERDLAPIQRSRESKSATAASDAHDYFPEVWSVAAETLDKPLSHDEESVRQQRAHKRANRPVPWERRDVKQLFLSPNDLVFKGKASATISAIFRRFITVTPYLDQLLLQRIGDASEEHGLSRVEWIRVFKGAVNDWSYTGPLSDVTRHFAAQLGMLTLIDEQPQVVPVPVRRYEPSLFLPDMDDAEDKERFFAGLENVGHGDGYYFHIEVPDGVQPPATENERYLYKPTAWRFNKHLAPRTVGDFSWFVEREPAIKTSQEVIEFIWQIPSAMGVIEWRKQGYDIWVNYSKGWVFVLRNMAEREGSASHGERVFARPVRLEFIHPNTGEYAPFIQDRDISNVRVWHEFDLDKPLPVPTDALDEVGSRTNRPDWQLSKAKWESISQRVIHRVAPSPPLPPPPVAPAVAVQQPRPVKTMRSWIDDHIDEPGGMSTLR